MALFQRNVGDEYEDYDDGFDELEDEEEAADEEDETEHELAEGKRSRIRLLFSIGNLAGVIAGTVVILVLVALLLSMVSFIQSDLNRNFSLLQTKF